MPANAALVQLKLSGNCKQHLNVAFILQICFSTEDDDDKGGNGPPG